MKTSKNGTELNVNESLESTAGVQALMRVSVIPHEARKLRINIAFEGRGTGAPPCPPPGSTLST